MEVIQIKMVYIASPFRGDYDTNLKNAMEYCRIASELGVLPVASHIMYSGWCRDDVPEQRELGLKLGLSLLEQSRELWVMGTHHSPGMKQEIAHAKQKGIPVYHVEHPRDPDYYPVSRDGLPLLCEIDCLADGMADTLQGKLVVLTHSRLKPEYRTPMNQIWLVTHGPGCQAGSFTGTVHLKHPLDFDCMAVGRDEICGAAKTETMEKLHIWYPQLHPRFSQADNVPEGMER